MICDKNYQPHILEILHEGDRWLCVRRNDRTTLGVICEADTREGAILGSYEPPRNPETL